VLITNAVDREFRSVCAWLARVHLQCLGGESLDRLAPFHASERAHGTGSPVDLCPASYIPSAESITFCHGSVVFGRISGRPLLYVLPWCFPQ